MKRQLGLDILSEKYAYGNDTEFGHTSAQKIPDRWVSTTCGYCSVGCGMFVGVRDGKAVSVRGNPAHPVNLGKLCPKGLSEHYTLDSPNRSRYPLLRRNGKLERITWEEALDAMVEKFRATQKKFGANSVGVLSTGQLVTEEFYTLGKLVQLGLGTNNLDGNTTLCMASAVSGYKRSFGSDGPPGAYDDLRQADVIFLIGANIADNHPILCQHLEANPNKTLIVADPRVTKTAMMADLYLPVKPRSDIALINGLIHVLIRAGAIDRNFISEHTSGFEELEKSVEKYTPAYVSQITGLSEDLILKTASLYGSAKAAFLGWTMGVNHSTQGAEPRLSPSPGNATPWGRARRDSLPACPDTGNSKAPKTATN
jgi:anaerobic selenocysteine-containing dehydrogenase